MRILLGLFLMTACTPAVPPAPEGDYESRTVVLSIPDLRPVMTMEIAWSFADPDGGRGSGKLQLTIHTVPR